MPKKRRSATPALGQNLTVRIDDAMRERLDRISDQKGLTLGAVVRDALESYVTDTEQHMVREEPSPSG